MPARPMVGDTVTYRSHVGDGVISPAMVLRTRTTTIVPIMEAWIESLRQAQTARFAPESMLEDIVVELPDDFTVDLLVMGLQRNYRMYTVPYSRDDAPKTWTDRRY